MLTIEKLARFVDKLPASADLTAILEDFLAKKDSSYRPCGSDGEAGGLLDFRGERLPVIIVPDLHARPDFLINLLKFRPDGLAGRSVLEALGEGSIIVVCVGDGVHTERYGDVVRAERMDNDSERWKDDYVRWMDSFAAWTEWRSGCQDKNLWRDCPSMQEEMRLCLSTVMSVMELKIAFPKHFHFLKGNHENIKNEDGEGNHAFRKFAMEGEMVKDFMLEYYGADVLDLMRDYETSLPIVAAFDRFCVSHAEPAYEFSRDEIINYHGANWNDVVLAFTWTPNGEAEEGSVAGIFTSLTGGRPEDALWFGGHRPVEGNFALRQDGHYVQIHNPDKMNVAYISVDRLSELEKGALDMRVWLKKCIIPLVNG